MCCPHVPDLGQSNLLRPVVFHSGARAEIRAMPQEVRLVLGKALLALQYGHSLSMPHSRASCLHEKVARDTEVGHRIGAAPPQGDAA